MLVEFELLQRAQQGDAGAFSQVVTAYRRRILGTISRLIGRPEDVEDVAQEVFLRLYFSLDQLRTPEVFEPWLYRLTVNASYDYLRKSKRRLLNSVCKWTNEKKFRVNKLLNRLIERCDQLNLRVLNDDPQQDFRVTAFITTLVMNYLFTGKFKRTK